VDSAPWLVSCVILFYIHQTNCSLKPADHEMSGTSTRMVDMFVEDANFTTAEVSGVGMGAGLTGLLLDFIAQDRFYVLGADFANCHLAWHFILSARHFKIYTFYTPVSDSSATGNLCKEKLP
jgi:hypothetical protein